MKIRKKWKGQHMRRLLKVISLRFLGNENACANTDQVSLFFSKKICIVNIQKHTVKCCILLLLLQWKC